MISGTTVENRVTTDQEIANQYNSMTEDQRQQLLQVLTSIEKTELASALVSTIEFSTEETIEEDIREEMVDRPVANPDIVGRTSDSGRNRARTITIESLDYGYLVKIGCQTIAIDDSKKLVRKLGEYLKDPNGSEKAWFAGEFKI